VSDPFNVILRAPAQKLERKVWADRVLGVLGALRELTGNAPFQGYRGDLPVTVPPERPAIEGLIDANRNTEAGQVFEDLGSAFAIGCTYPPGDPDENNITAQFTVATTNPKFHNALTVSVNDQVPYAQVRRLFEAVIPIWRPHWGCVSSTVNQRQRRGDEVAFDDRLHWCTYFGPEKKAFRHFEVLERTPGVTVRRIYDGVEVILGEWTSPEDLLAEQRRLEPEFLQGSRGAAQRS